MAKKHLVAIHLKVNTFVHLVRLDDWCFRHVRYFSVRREGEDLSLFHEFMDKMGQVKAANQELDWMLNWIEHIGDNVPYPLRDEYFRHEGAAMALPPPAQKANQARRSAKREARDREVVELEVGKLRLYCHPVNDHVVFLFSGALKTEGVKDVKDCPVVYPHFKLANTLARKIDRAFQDGDISWTDSATDIEYEEDLELEL